MYVQNEGQFSTLKTVIAYYSVFILMVFFNTYINFNFDPALKKLRGSKRTVGHKPTFVKQTIYFLMFFVLNLGLSIATELSMKEDMKLIDINGIPHPLSPGQVGVMMAIGWICFLLSWAFNALFYKLHPSSIDFDKERFGERFHVHLRGHKKTLWTPAKTVEKQETSLIQDSEKQDTVPTETEDS